MFTELKTWTCILPNTLLSHLCTIDIHWTVLNIIPSETSIQPCVVAKDRKNATPFPHSFFQNPL